MLNKSEPRLYNIDKNLELTIEGLKKIHLGKKMHDFGREPTPEEQKLELEKNIKFNWKYPLSELEMDNKKYKIEEISCYEKLMTVLLIKRPVREEILELILAPLDKEEKQIPWDI